MQYFTSMTGLFHLLCHLDSCILLRRAGLPFLKPNGIPCMYTLHVPHPPPIGGYFGCLPVLVTVNDAAVTMGVQASCCNSDCSCFG